MSLLSLNSFVSSRLLISSLFNDDAEALMGIYSNQEAMQYRGGKPMRNRLEAYAMVSHQNCLLSGTFYRRMAIRLKDKNTLIGSVLFKESLTDPMIVTFGLSIGQEYWYKGYGNELLPVIETILKSQTSIKEIKAWCMKENSNSISLFKKNRYTNISQDNYPESILFQKGLY